MSFRMGGPWGRIVVAAALGLAMAGGGCDDAEKDQLKQDVATLQAQIKSLTDDLAAAKSGKDASDAKSASLTSQLADAAGKAAALLTQVEQTKALYDGAMSKVTAAEQQATKLKGDFDKATEQAKAQAANLAKQVKDTAAKLADSQKLTAAAQAEADALKKQVSDLTTQVQDLTTKVAELTQALKDGQGLQGLLNPSPPPKK